MLQFPAWDCLPYDRVSPHGAIVAQRMTTLSRLARVKGREKPAVLLTTVNAALQRVPARELIGKQALSAAPGNAIGMEGVVRWLELNGFNRASTVREFGDYAVRGGILDLFASGMDLPVRLDFFGDTLETIRSFDPETQRTVMEMRALDLVPVAEFQLMTDTIRKFRTGYVAAFGAADPEDMLYEAVSEGRRHPGMEHWLPLFHDKLDTLFDYVPGAPVILENLVEDAARERLAQINDYYEARKEALAEHSGTLYKPLPPDRLYLPEAEWAERLNTAALARLTPFAVPEEGGAKVDVGARAGHNFSAERADNAAGVFDAVSKHVQSLQAAGKRVVIALWSEGARERMKHVLAEHGLHNLSPVASWLGGAGAAEAAGRARGAGARRRLRDRRRRRRQRAGHPGRPAGAAAPRGQALGQFHRRGDEPVAPAISSCMSITASAASSACRTSRRPARRTTAWKSTTPKAPSSTCRSRTSSCCRATARRTPASSSIGSAAPAGRPARRG